MDPPHHEQHEEQQQHDRQRQHPEFELLWETTSDWQRPSQVLVALYFLRACRLIGRNDSNVRDVRPYGLCTPQGYGIALGDALCKTNSQVSSIHLDFEKFLGPIEEKKLDDMAIRPMQQFLATSTSVGLLELSGHNVVVTDRLMSVSEKLPTAASENRSVEQMSCGGFVSPRGSHTFMSNSTSLIELNISLLMARRLPYSFDGQALIVSAFQANRSIPLCGSSNWNYARDILSLLTLGEGPKLTELILDNTGSSPVSSLTNG